MGKTWTTPRTWTTSELVTAAIMNTHVRDNLNNLKEGLIPGGTIQIIYCTLGGTANHQPVVGGVVYDGWHLCNGGSQNGYTTPDLRDRFVIGAGSTYGQGDTGGAATKNLQHTHAVNGNTSNNAQAMDGSPTQQVGSNNTAPNPHTHPVSITSANGGSTTQDIMPPYYGLYYFMYCGT